jgi:hypothetical protein
MQMPDGERSMPGVERLMELYDSGMSTHKIAEDPALQPTLLAGIEKPESRRWKVYHLINGLIVAGHLTKRDRFARRETKERIVATTLYESDTKAVAPTESKFEEFLQKYERLIGAATKRRTAERRQPGELYEAVVFSDPHIPEERMDLIAEMSERHKGLDCYVAGDINDFAQFGKYLKTDWDFPTLKECLAKTDAMFEALSRFHPNLYVMFGNHDLRLPRAASRALGPDYYWMSQEFLVMAYERRHGVKVIRNHIDKECGRSVDLYYYHQVGDCIISHAEHGGAKVGAGVEKAHRFYRAWQHQIGLSDFRVVLQAHTHKCSYYEHPETGCHLFEIGTLGDMADYALHDAKYSPPQFGYFHLVQKDGVTDINASRLYRWS